MVGNTHTCWVDADTTKEVSGNLCQFFPSVLARHLVKGDELRFKLNSLLSLHRTVSRVMASHAHIRGTASGRP